MSILDNIVGLYNFNGNANDSSGNGFHGTVNGAILANDNLGNSNSAYSFNGVSDTLELPNSMLLLVDGYTVCFWFNPVTKLTRSRPISSTNLFTGYYGNAGGSGTNFQWFVGDGTSYSPGAGIASFISFGVWQFICISYDKTTGKLYKNGVLAQTQAYSSATINQTNIIEIGEGASNFCEGTIAQAKVYNRALSDAEILQLYNTGRGVHSEVRGGILSKSISNIGIDTTGIVAMYNFNGNANDSSGNGYNGTVTGATLIPDQFGNTNSAYDFNGTNQYITLPEAAVPASFPITIECVARPDAVALGPTNDIILQAGNRTNNQSFGIAFGGVTIGQKIMAYAWGQPNILSDTTYTLGQVYHIVLTIDTGKVASLFINGVKQASTQTYTSLSIVGTLRELGRLGLNDTYALDGGIYRFATWSRVLTDAEIMQLANVKRGVHSLTKGTQIVNHTDNIGVDTTSLVGLYNASGVDVTGNGNTASVSGAVTYSEDTYGNYIDFNGDRNFSLLTGTPANLYIGNKMNYNQTQDFSWFVTHSVLSPNLSNGSGVFGSAYDNAIYISNVVGAVTVNLRGSTNVSIGVGSNYWNTRYGEVHTIGFTYVASETKFYVYLDGVLQNVGGTLGPTTFLTNEWWIGDSAIGGGDASSCHKKIYNIGVFGRILTEAEHLKLHNKTVGKGVRNKGLLSINQLTNL